MLMVSPELVLPGLSLLQTCDCVRSFHLQSALPTNSWTCFCLLEEMFSLFSGLVRVRNLTQSGYTSQFILCSMSFLGENLCYIIMPVLKSVN